jgi:hypothetical protein
MTAIKKNIDINLAEFSVRVCVCFKFFKYNIQILKFNFMNRI